MAVFIRPENWKGIDPRSIDPESAKRLASGFWHRDYSMETQTETWTCDKRKLNDAMAQTLIDPQWSRLLAELGPSAYLDKRFGKGSAEAFHTKSNGERLQMRFNDKQYMDRYMGSDPAKGKDMAMATFANFSNGTTTTADTSTYTTAGSGESYIRYPSPHEYEKKRSIHRQFKQKNPNKLVRKMPFKVEYGGSLLDALQREFDYWAKPQMELVNG